LEKTRLIQVDESDLRDRVYATLERSLVGADPDSAFELLSNWLYLCAETKPLCTESA
jgi:hypothetical protein